MADDEKKGQEEQATAFVLDDGYAETLSSTEPQHFGTIPGLWAPGVPVLLSDLDPALSERDFRALLREHDLTDAIKAVDVDADYKPKPGMSQFELRQRGEGSHLPAGPPVGGRTDETTGRTYRQMRVGALREIAEARGVDVKDSDGNLRDKKELVDELEALDSGQPDDGSGAIGGPSTGGPGLGAQTTSGGSVGSGGVSTPAGSYLVVNLEESPRYENAPVIAPYRVSTVNTYYPLQTARVAPNPQLIDRGDELRNIEGSLAQLVESYEPSGSLGYRAYLNSFIVLLALAGFDYTVTAGAGTAATPGVNSTTVTGVNALNSATVNVGNTAGFPTAGSFILGGVLTTYTGKTPTSFTGCGNHAATTGGETVQDVLPVGANKWILTKRGGAAVGGIARTAQIIAAYVEHGVYLQGQGYGVSNLTLNAQGEVGTDWMGLVLARVANPGLTPSYDAGTIPPVRRGDLYLSWLAGGGVVDDFSFAIANPLVRRRTLSLNPPSKFPDVMQMGDDRVRLTGTIPKAALATADWDALMAASTFAAKAIWSTPVNIGATTYPYTMVVDMPSCQYIGGQPDEIANRRRFGGSFDFWAAWDETAAYDVRVQIANAVAAISTPF